MTSAGFRPTAVALPLQSAYRVEEQVGRLPEPKAAGLCCPTLLRSQYLTSRHALEHSKDRVRHREGTAESPRTLPTEKLCLVPQPPARGRASLFTRLCHQPHCQSGLPPADTSTAKYYLSIPASSRPHYRHLSRTSSPSKYFQSPPTGSLQRPTASIPSSATPFPLGLSPPMIIPSVALGTFRSNSGQSSHQQVYRPSQQHHKFPTSSRPRLATSPSPSLLRQDRSMQPFR